MSSLLDETGMVDANPAPARDYLHLVGGRAVVQLKAVADRRLTQGGSVVSPKTPAYYPGLYGAQLQALSVDQLVNTVSLLDPLASEFAYVDQWVDERTYERRRADPGKSWTATDTSNQVRDWLEKKVWDIVTDQPDDQSGETATGCSTLTVLLEQPQGSNLAEVNLAAPSILNANPLFPILRHPARPGSSWGHLYYHGFEEVFPADAARTVFLHESRHAWQGWLKSHGAVDRDHDWLFDPSSVPSSAAEMFDAPNHVVQPGGNADGHFKGDGPGLSDWDDPAFGAVRAMAERNAMRFTNRTGLDSSLECALSGFSLVSGDNQMGPAMQPLPQPLVVEVNALAGPSNSHTQSGVTVEFTCIAGDATINGGGMAYAMTGPDGRASVSLTNGTVDSQILAEVVPLASPQNICSHLTTPSQIATVRVQK
jgi:hypothetical protein